jgi:acetylornithine deacetylase/succinyl-diaminopimelate desuccinylase-like protein
MSVSIDRDRLVDWASKAISIPSFTGSEEQLARFVQATFEELGLQVQWQQVEEGRANVLGTLTGAGGGPALMFNGHMDTSYSGREPWLAHVPGFQPEPFVRMREVLDAVLEWIAAWEDDPGNEYRGAKAIVNVGALQGGFGWRVSRTPHRTDLFLDVRVPPTKPMPVARREVLEMVRGLAERFPEYGIEGEVYVTAPGAEIAEDHPLVAAIDESHAEVFGSPPERDVTRWFSDASALTRYGVPTVNYGTSTGLLDTEFGENLEIEGLVRMANVYALAAQRVCGVA